MSLTTFKNSQTITAVDYKYIRRNIIFSFSDGQKLIMKALSECCSYSFFQEEKGYNFSSLVGEKIVSFQSYPNISSSIKNIVEETVRRFQGYKFKLESGKDFKFFLVNDSNGWYTGWIEIEGQEEAPQIDPPSPITEPVLDPIVVKSTLNPFAKPFIPTKKLNPNSKVFVPSIQ